MNPIFWFRRDLRYFANEALIEAIENGATEALFFVCQKQWQQHNCADIQIDLLKRRVAWLGQALCAYGIHLNILEVDDFSAIPKALKHFCDQQNTQLVYANAEYELNERQRDQHCIDVGIQLELFHGDLMAPPKSVRTKSGEMFKVFTPFKKAWLKQYEQSHVFIPSWPKPALNQAPSWHVPDCLHSDGSSQKWPVDDDAIASVAAHFVESKCQDYKSVRDIPSIKGTSGLSPYLALGILSVKQLLAQLQLNYPDILHTTERPEFCWVNELIWREFYRHLIIEFADLCKHHNFNAKYNAVAWRYDKQQFQAWCEGKTGYPLVDAAMRQLNQTGWMHNRLRMVVASFLTKHLLIDWRWGEKYFMQKLIDGDFASNNGGWQWAASTGCDAQPYFRIFNPITQSKKFDPQGDFIRKYVPELESVPIKYLHFPHDYLASTQSTHYVSPIVDHKEARERALAAFKV
ncbi:Deoxyribodipyrimidine photo-lyase [Pseudoalteromonas holothuriae]|uniref:Deoxyribodipyrimidine photo-lyase n=1 Tax=Pseudoalteromonas holothuriae TaxID=2963714 RepID=A0A9W4VZC0_9GAMM|nr:MULTISPECIES: deoxyribodipyrimidine photo-lyase [unclassified Pseudoalteromonas]CAH9065260.1 Deoxyribodipyrimidine photo-lyase [Pseudoalteromonas sp. CIP111854]CAH9066490.1 Deoxyribodipyrimidine photo-lyase [Pseudoalteromonas sp. CIP111951]